MAVFGGKRSLEVVYKTVAGRELKLDLYYPTTQTAEKCPVVVFTHGGGWAAGSRHKAASGLFAEVFSQLVKLRGQGITPAEFELDQPLKWTPKTLRQLRLRQDCR